MSKVLLINNCYPTSLFPNKSTYIRSIEEGLIEAGITVNRLVLTGNNSSLLFKITNYLNFYRKLILFSGYQNYDYIYIHHFPFVFFPLIPYLKKFNKTIINWHGQDLIPSTFINEIICRTSYKFLNTEYTHIVPSKYYESILSNKLNIEPKKIIVSPSGGVDTKIFSPNPCKKVSNSINIGFASGISMEKGIDFILYVLKHQNKMPANVVFHIINYGKEKKKYLKEILKNENIILHSAYQKNQMFSFYRKIDVLAFPTKKESLGLVALEAMSCGIPVVGPAHFALKSIIKNGINGESYKTFSYDNFLCTLIQCVKNLGNYTPRESILEKFSKESVIQQYKEIFS